MAQMLSTQVEVVVVVLLFAAGQKTAAFSVSGI